MYGQQMNSGEIKIKANGKCVTMTNGADEKVIDGIDNRDCVLFVRLRPGKWAEFI